MLFIILHYFVYICNTLFHLFSVKFFSPAANFDFLFPRRSGPAKEGRTGFFPAVPLRGTLYPQKLLHYWHKCCNGPLWMEEIVDNVDNSVNKYGSRLLPGDSLWMLFFANPGRIDFLPDSNSSLSPQEKNQAVGAGILSPGARFSLNNNTFHAFTPRSGISCPPP